MQNCRPDVTYAEVPSTAGTQMNGYHGLKRLAFTSVFESEGMRQLFSGSE